MKRNTEDKALRERIRTGKVTRTDIARRLAELAFSSAGDCVRLALEEEPQVDKLDLSLLSEIKRNGKGAVEIKLVSRLQALELLAQMAETDTLETEDFLAALRGETA